MEACSEPASAQELPGFAHDKMGIGVFAGVEGSAMNTGSILQNRLSLRGNFPLHAALALRRCKRRSFTSMKNSYSRKQKLWLRVKHGMSKNKTCGVQQLTSSNKFTEDGDASKKT